MKPVRDLLDLALEMDPGRYTTETAAAILCIFLYSFNLFAKERIIMVLTSIATVIFFYHNTRYRASSRATRRLHAAHHQPPGVAEVKSGRVPSPHQHLSLGVLHPWS